jgi:glycosyltransferase involved in cell wall biosynthesis
MKTAYVTAFQGRRDSYQIPLALFENGRLAKFVTDGYDAGPWARALKMGGFHGIDRRRCPELPDARVDCNFLFEFAARVLGRIQEPSRASVIADGWFARRAAALANARGCSLLLYEFQAELGFQLLQSSRQRRILFHFHPHPGWEHPILANDVRAYPEFSGQVASMTRSALPARFSEHTKGAWRQADHILVASSCTRNSLVHAGCPEGRITVVPYGREAVESEGPLDCEPRVDGPFILWVGAGSYRKGLHHLCRAWSAFDCSAYGRLIVIARAVDPGMGTLLETDGIQWMPGVSRAELNWYYRHARALVMPSLSEGFGQVYLEALSNGCPVVGTRNSVLPDLAAAQRWIRYVKPGDIEGLAAQLREMLCGLPSESLEARGSIMASVREYSWERFRAGVESVLRRFD